MAKDDRQQHIVPRIIFGIFLCIWRMQNAIMSMAEKSTTELLRGKINRYANIAFGVAFFVSFALIFVLPAVAEFFAVTSLILLVIKFIADFVLSLDRILTSIRQLLYHALILSFSAGVAGLMLSISLLNDNVKRQGYSTIILLALFWFCVGLFWLILSLLASAKVATMANAIATGLVTIAKYIADTYVNMKNILDVGDFGGLTRSQMWQGICAVSFTPVQIILGTTALACALRAYWVAKYNNGCDMERLSPEATE